MPRRCRCSCVQLAVHRCRPGSMSVARVWFWCGASSSSEEPEGLLEDGQHGKSPERYPMFFHATPNPPLLCTLQVSCVACHQSPPRLRKQFGGLHVGLCMLYLGGATGSVEEQAQCIIVLEGRVSRFQQAVTASYWSRVALGDSKMRVQLRV